VPSRRKALIKELLRLKYEVCPQEKERKKGNEMK
jgi:hypothetical protein